MPVSTDSVWMFRIRWYCFRAREIVALPDPIGEVIEGFTRLADYRFRKHVYLLEWSSYL